MIRIVEDNDWVIFSILGIILVFIIVLQYLQKESGIKSFFLQNYIDSGNVFLSWLLISLCFILLLSILVSKFTLIVPRFISEIGIFDLKLNRFGYTLLVFCIYYFLKFIFSFLFYNAIGQTKKWERFYYVNSKFYFGLSIILIISNIIVYYFPIDKLLFFRTSLFLTFFLMFFKTIYYLFNKNKILPNEWHYKILYICTLQFTPLLVVWKLLFS